MIAIHKSLNGFHPRWVRYCDENNIPYKIVNCYDNSIIEELQGCEALLWHFHHNSVADLHVARKILFALEHTGLKVFPNFYTAWHFDDKLAQKFLLESLKVPFINSYVFVEKDKAISWSAKTDYPKVFKLKGGAGSQNVRLVRSATEAKSLINIAFSSGFKNYDALSNFKERFRKWRLGKFPFFEVVKSLIRFIIPPNFTKGLGREYGYVYFQDFIDGNDSDIRIIVINNKAFALKRFVRENDFRASGSGNFAFEKENFDDRTLKLAFETAKKLKAQCVAFDFIFLKNNPVIVEISYGFNVPIYDNCQGFWDENLNWYEGSFNPYGWMIENIIDKE